MVRKFRKWQIVLNEACGEACGFCEEIVADWIAKPILNETCMQRKIRSLAVPLQTVFIMVKIQFVPHREHSLHPLEMALGQIFFRVRLFSLCQFHSANPPYSSSSTYYPYKKDK